MKKLIPTAAGGRLASRTMDVTRSGFQGCDSRVLVRFVAVFAVALICGHTNLSLAQPANDRSIGSVQIPGEIVADRLRTDYPTTAGFFVNRGEFGAPTEYTFEPGVPIRIEWSTEAPSVTRVRWQLCPTEGRCRPIAQGEVDANNFRFTIPQSVFWPSPDNEGRLQRYGRYAFVITPLQQSGNRAANSARVFATRGSRPQDGPGPFAGWNRAVFPRVEIASSSEQIGQVHLTQLFYNYLDLTLLARNLSDQPTAPVNVRVADERDLWRGEQLLTIPSLDPGETWQQETRLQANVGPPQSQADEQRQQRAWRQRHQDLCGPVLHVNMDYAGPASQAPLNPSQKQLIVESHYADYPIRSPELPVCWTDGAGATQCIQMCEFEKNLRAELDGAVKGYSVFLGPYPRSFGGGYARTEDGQPPLLFDANTQLPLASVSKMITAYGMLAATRQRRVNVDPGFTIDTPLGPFFPPNWQVQQHFRNRSLVEYLRQSSGIYTYANGFHTYDQMQTLFETGVTAGQNAAFCGCSDIPSNDANRPWVNTMANPQWCYSNANTAIMRMLLPALMGIQPPADANVLSEHYGQWYEALMQQLVFEPLGIGHVGCRPTSPNNALAYDGFQDPKPGGALVNQVEQCGARGWTMSANELGRLLMSLGYADGRVVSDADHQLTMTRALVYAGETCRNMDGTSNTGSNIWGMGWDLANLNVLTKNGGTGGTRVEGGRRVAAGTISTVSTIFNPTRRPGWIPAVVLVNSGGRAADAALFAAYNNSVYTP